MYPFIMCLFLFFKLSFSCQLMAHYLIEKSVENKTTVSKIKCLSGEESIDELARMLGGVEITEKVRESAREMKELAYQKKCH